MSRAMIDRAAVDRVLAANRYLVVGTADEDGEPWVSPVFFGPLALDPCAGRRRRTAWHSRNIAQRARFAITVFDSTVEVGRAEAAYFRRRRPQATPEETAAALQSLNACLPPDKQIRNDDLPSRGRFVVCRADLRRFVLVRGGNPEFGDAVGMTVEV